MIQELIDDVNQHQLRKISTRPEDSLTDDLGFYLSKPQPGNQAQGTFRNENDSSTDQVVTKAADMKKRSDDILANIQMVGYKIFAISGVMRNIIFLFQEQNKDYLDWLQKWDSFLVNHVLQPISQSNDLKAMVRTGIPSTYRSRVWKR